MKCDIGKIWEAGMIQQKEKNPDREQKRGKFGRRNEEGDIITISEEARQRWTSVTYEESDVATKGE